MSAAKVVNFLLAGLLIMTIIMFSWTFVYINSTLGQSNVSAPIVSAFSA